MDNAATGQNTPISIFDALKKAWHLVHGLKWPVFAAYLSGFIVLILLNIVSFILSPTHLGVFLGGLFTFVITILAMYVNWFVLAMLLILGVRQALGLRPNHLGDAFSSCAASKSNLFGMMLIYYIGVFIYVFLWVLANVMADNGVSYLIVAALCIIATIAAIFLLLPIPIFALPLLITTRCGIFSAIKQSYRMFNRCWIRLIISLILMLIILAISAIPLGIGLIWTIPMTYALNGIWFKEMSSL